MYGRLAVIPNPMAHTTAELRELFDLIDADHSGALDREEIRNLAGRLGKHLT